MRRVSAVPRFLWVLSVVTLCAAVPARGQTVPASDCPNRVGEDEDAWVSRCNSEYAAQSGARLAKTQRAVADLRAELERQPPLAAAKNPLLGRWMPQAGTQGGSSDIVGQLAGMISGASCNMMFGDGGVEFRQRTMVSFDGGSEESLGQVSYRARNKMVYVLPETGVRLMPFEINGPNQVTFTAGASPCTLSRVGSHARNAEPTAPVSQGAGTAGVTAGATALAEGTAYRCPGGGLIFVGSCAFGQPGDPACMTDHYDLPKINGYVQVITEKRTDLANRVRSCEAGTLQFAADGSPVFVPGSH